jgi:hypothetical protein
MISAALCGLAVIGLGLVAACRRSATPEDDPKTLNDRLREFRDPVRARLSPAFARAGVAYPPGKVVLIGLKEERSLEVHAADATGVFRFICAYPILGASGGPGPKLMEGDRQVPEGFYGVESLNPNSLFHLSLRINYPNEFDRKRAKEEGRANPGGDIMIHGGSASIGCLAMGDEAAEELFVLVALTGAQNVRVLLSPRDFRRMKNTAPPENTPPWTAPLYLEIAAELEKYPR